MRISLSAAALAALCLLISCDETAHAQTDAKGTAQSTTIILGTGPQPDVGFAGIGKACTNYQKSFYSPTTNTVVACVNTGVIASNTRGVLTIVNAGGVSGIPSSGTNTIPFVVSGGSTQPAIASNVISLFSGSNGFLKSDGTIANPPGTTIPSVTALLKGNGSGNATSALFSDVVTLFASGSCSGFLKSDGTCGTAGAALPSITQVLKGNGSGNATAATSGDVISLWTSCSAGFLKFDGTCATPTGTLPTTTALIKGDGSGGGAAATFSSVVSLFGSGSCAGWLKNDGTCSSPTATIPGGTTLSLPLTNTPYSLYAVNDASSGIPIYQYNSSGNSPLKLLDAGATGALTMATPGQIDINTSVVPRLAAANTFSGSNTFGGTTTANNLTVTGTCTGCTGTGMTNPMTTLGDIIAGGASGAPARLGIGSSGQVLTVSSGQPVWAAPAAAGSTYPSITDNGSAVTITASGDTPFFTIGSNSTQTCNGLNNSSSNSGSGATQIHNYLTCTEGGAFVLFDAHAGIRIEGMTSAVGTSNPTPMKWLDGGLMVNKGGHTQPSCDSVNRGEFWYTAGGTGVKDAVEVCAKDAANAYAWRTIY